MNYRILITGASSGIGRDVALKLATKGHLVFGVGRNEGALKEMAAISSSFVPLVGDINDSTSRKALFSGVIKRTDGYGLDVLVNNAGFGHNGPVSEISEEDLRAQFETNVFSLMAMTQLFLPLMQSRRKGRIINISSIGGRVTFPLFGAYHATKYSVEALSDALRMELAPLGIKVILIEPGMIQTRFSERSYDISRRYEQDSEFGDMSKVNRTLFNLSNRLSVGPEHTSRAIEKAIHSIHPRARYVTPYRSYFILWCKWLLPSSLMDRIMARSVGLV